MKADGSDTQNVVCGKEKHSTDTQIELWHLLHKLYPISFLVRGWMHAGENSLN